MAVTQAQLQQLYLAYFGRPADFDGIVFYTTGNWDIWQVARAFGESPESQALYGSGFSAATINSIYQNLFNRDAEPDGLLYWSQQVASGALTIGEAALGILLGAQNADLTTVNNKLAAAAAFTAAVDTSAEIIGYSGDAAAAAARAWLHGVTADAASLENAVANVDGAVAGVVNVGGPSGETLTLTTGIDVINGTAGNDTIVGVNDNFGTGDIALNVGDELNGGNGEDTLQVTLNDSGMNLNGITLNSIENLLVKNVAFLPGSDSSDLGGNAFTNVTFTGLMGGSTSDRHDINGLVSSSNVSVQGSKADSSYFSLNFDPNSDASVAINNTVTGTGKNSPDAWFDFNHDLTDATSVAATLNLVNSNADTDGYTWADMYLTVEAADAQVNANIVVTGATSDGTDYSGADMYVYQDDGSATVHGNVAIANSDSVYVEIEADEDGDSDGSLTDTVDVSLSNVTDTYDEETGNMDAGIYLGDFEVVNVSVTGDSTVAYLDVSNNNASTAFESQTMSINASADFTALDYVEMAQTGSTALTITGSGNVDLNDYWGTADALSTTVKSTIDASGLTGDLSVDVQSAINSVKGGSGDDTIILENTSTFGDATKGGLTAAGGAGQDTIGMNVASWTAISGGSATNRAAISGFENLLLTDALTTGDYDLAKLTGLTGFTAANGIVSANTATVKNVGSTTSIGLQGDLVTNNGTLEIVLKTDGTDDTANLTLKPTFDQNNDATADTIAVTETVSAVGVEHLNIVSSSKADEPVETGMKTDKATNTLMLTDDDLVDMTVTGNTKFIFTVAATQEAFASFDASGSTGGAAFDGGAAAGALTIKGSAGANTLTGSALADTITGGAKGDTIHGGAGADTMTGGAGNDVYTYSAATESTLAKLDTITDFHANTFGNGTNGAAGTGAGADTTKWTGDVIQLDVDTVTFTKVAATAQTNATNAQVYIQNTADATTDTVIAALDSSTGTLYIDWNSDGTIDSVIQLTGVTTINAAAFTLV